MVININTHPGYNPTAKIRTQEITKHLKEFDRLMVKYKSKRGK